MEIVKATEDDIEAVLNLQSQIYRVNQQSEGANEALKSQLSDESCDVYVGKENGKVLATATLYYIQVAVRNRPYALLEGLVVDEAQRGKGLGTQLFNKIVDTARQKNCYKIIFTSGTDRTDAHEFYEKLGFVKRGLEFRRDL